ncbi:Brix-domain-containing protein [Basidiobolus meristosporus CBS 931.73]|uniref:Ribosome production factor 2 homolog n=1 Tax=Basidiobolus meristosporus CBS 931.73 TaxID=1314790 RepID=A0A1Y1Z1K2_9FUNG|nr:Brix-domain-containing protein [Basidiobolus meristosporus CBS 931.73]|eukprot:ORY04089.1 Brix-domain-containing protein [Basidiobolus meristosporus CBS 931.73]
MLRAIKPKNARSKRAFEKREPKVVENTKTALFIRGSQTSQIVNDALNDLYSLKKPDAINFTKKNQIHPFDDDTSLEFFSKKNDTSLFVVGTHSKKRPHNLILGRTFDHQILDMLELGIERATPIKEFKSSKCAVGMKPCFVFNGEIWDQREDYSKLKNMLLDFYHGQTVDSVNLAGLEYVISVTAGPLKADGTPGTVYFRVYTIQMKKSGQRTPRVELEEMGPSLDLTFRRSKFAPEEIMKQATKAPRELKPKKVKNIQHDEMGDKFGRIHLGRQDFEKIQTRKMKGLKKESDKNKKRKTSEEESEGEE